MGSDCAEQSKSDLEISRCSNISGTSPFFQKFGSRIGKCRKGLIRRISSRVDFFADMPTPMHHLKSMKRCQKASLNPMLLHLRLDNVGAYNLDVDVGDKRFSTIITLKQVPSFLIEAFTRLNECDAWNVEGIFRKEGNVNRIKNVIPVYFGTVPIPRECMIHDICTLIKRFFREIRAPIFADKQRTLLKYAENLADNNSTTVNSILETINKGLLACHVGTLGYLMRLLKEISENCYQHKMTVENLAKVFAPSLFRDESLTHQIWIKRREGNDNLISLALTMNELQVSVIKLLIQNSHIIGMPRTFYKASRKPSDLRRHKWKLLNSSVTREFGLCGNLRSSRSTSAASNLRTQFSATNAGQPTVKNVEEEKNLKDRYSIRESLKKRKNYRASSLTRLFGDVKSFLTTPSFENEHCSRCMELNSMSRFHRSLSPNVKFRNRLPTNEKDKFLNFEDEPKMLTPPDVEKSPGFSNSRFIIEEIKKADKNEDLSTNSTDKKLTENYVAHRPSLVAFQRNHCGFVRQRVNLFDTSAGFNTSDLNRSLACERIIPQNLPSLSAHQGLKELPVQILDFEEKMAIKELEKK